MALVTPSWRILFDTLFNQRFTRAILINLTLMNSSPDGLMFFG
ncbi:MAG: hypothetical protein Pg6C_11700 [Treponemataceae bacterium]|nr:MAG: hypothetical protein Pg6C_11700 [Treponemataceae bacterium]